MKVKMLWILNGDESYGVRRIVLETIMELKKRGGENVFLAFGWGDICEDIKDLGFEIYNFEIKGGLSVDSHRNILIEYLRIIVCTLNAIRRSLVLMKENQVNCINFSWNQFIPFAGMLSVVTGTPSYWQIPNAINNRLPFKMQPIIYQLFSKIGKIYPLPNSKYTQRTLGSEIIESNVVYLGLNENHFSPIPKLENKRREFFGERHNYPLFSVIARVVPSKAQDILVDAVLRLAGRVNLLIAGGPTDSEYYKKIERTIDENNAKDYIKMIGPVSDPRTVYALSDVIINSRTGAEPFGLTVIEAMLMQRPVLALNLGGPAETVIDDVTGWLIDGNETQSYVMGMERALRDKEKWVKMGCDARLHCIENFTISRSVDHLLEVIYRDMGQVT